MVSNNFNPRSREGSDQNCETMRETIKDFNPRSREGSDEGVYTTEKGGRNFNPRSREGSDDALAFIIQYHGISIRAPARGATTREQNLTPFTSISIRAPARGATSRKDSYDLDVIISIRAPARGATEVWHISYSSALFQSALPRGERPAAGTHIRNTSLFQSALPRGERLLCYPYLSCIFVFQSALPRGERLSPAIAWIIFRSISIRAPARGATSIFAKKFSSLLAKIV